MWHNKHGHKKNSQGNDFEGNKWFIQAYDGADVYICGHAGHALEKEGQESNVAFHHHNH